MMIEKSEQELREIVDDWAQAYFKGEIYGFGLSDDMDYPTFIKEDMGICNVKQETGEDLNKSGFRADTHRVGTRIGRGFRVKAVFDNNHLIQNTVRRGYEILSPEEIRNMGKIKIAIFPRRYHAIKKQLESYGLEEYKDFIYFGVFLTFYNYYIQHEILIWEITVAVTSRCTLRCEKCNMFMPHYKNPSDIPYEELISDLETLFSRINNVQYYGILGGEPLIYKRLPEYLANISKYKNRIGEFLISTNGSVIPNDEVIKITKEMGNVRYDSSKYLIDDEYEANLAGLIAKVKNNGMSYTLRNYDWSDYRRKDAIDDIEELKMHYIRCNQPFTAFQSGRFYTCHLPWSAARCGISGFDPRDSLDFTDPAVSDLDIIKASLGHIERGYTSNCAMCNGCDPEYYVKIPKAVQIKRDRR